VSVQLSPGTGSPAVREQGLCIFYSRYGRCEDQLPASLRNRIPIILCQNCNL